VPVKPSQVKTNKAQAPKVAINELKPLALKGK